MTKLGSVVALAWLVVGASALGGCGGVDLACQTTTCTGESAKTYQVCATTTGVTDKFGGTSCSCSSTNTSCLEQCTQRVAVYCGGSTDGMLSTDMAMHPCTMSISGAITGSATCLATTVWASGSNLGGPTLSMTSAAMGVTLEATLTRPGTVTSGAWSSTDTGAKGAITAITVGVPPPTWNANVGSSSPQGTYSMNLTVESSSTVSTGDVYIATGTIMGTLLPLNGTGATGTVDFTASF